MLVVGVHEGQDFLAADGCSAFEREALLTNRDAVARRPAVLLDGIEEKFRSIHDDRPGAISGRRGRFPLNEIPVWLEDVQFMLDALRQPLSRPRSGAAGMSDERHKASRGGSAIAGRGRTISSRPTLTPPLTPV